MLPSYVIRHYPEYADCKHRGEYRAVGGGLLSEEFGSLEQAQDACQGDFVKLMLGGLED